MTLLLTDLDEVVLDWDADFVDWIVNIKKIPHSGKLDDHENIEEWLHCSLEQTRMLVREFNESEYFVDIKPLPDATKVIPELVGMGYRFIAITACANNAWTVKTRMDNLQRYFGNAFTACICTGLNSSKFEQLSWFKPTIWYDDKPRNVISGIQAGHTSFLKNVSYNKSFSDPNAIRVDGWEDILNYIKMKEAA